jgi:HPt (histidine-containing phosphotransfer) domain-containing protein
MGADDYITKPVKKEILKTSIAKWLTPQVVASNQGAGEAPLIDYDIFDMYKEVMAEKFASSIQLFSEDTRRLIDKLMECHKANNLQSMAAVAHTLKSASAVLGLSALSDMARSLEDAARDQVTAGGKASNIPQRTLQQLEQDYTNALELLRTLPDTNGEAT